MNSKFSVLPTILLSVIGAGFSMATYSHRVFAQPIVPAMDGTGTIIQQQGNQFNIQGGQLSGDGKNLFHSLQEFGLSAGQIANFLANPQVHNILTRVTGGNASLINGLLQVSGSNANLYLMNPAGIIFGADAQLNVPGDFIATTANSIGFSNSQWFNAVGDNNWTELVGTPNEFRFDVDNPGSIVNFGDLAVSEGADISLIAGNIINVGTIEAPGGTINIVAIPDRQILRITQEGHLLSLDIPIGDRQTPEITAIELPELLTHGGISHSDSIEVSPEGQVVLSGSGVNVPDVGGVAIASGTLDVSGDTGGTINIMGDRVGAIDANINASGLFGGGTLRLGGGFKGSPLFPTAEITYINDNSILNASAQESGNGGNIFIWSEQQTIFDGNIFALGGLEGGDGGFVEVSSKGDLAFNGDVDLSSPLGNNGQLLLDPKNILIVDGADGADDSELDDNEILAGDGADETFIISEHKLENILLASDVVLEATNDITIEKLTDGVLGGSIYSLEFIADSDNDGAGSFSMESGDRIITGAAVTISGVNLRIGGIHTQSPFQESGKITLNATGSVEAEKLSTYAGTYSAGDVTIISEGDVTIGHVEARANQSVHDIEEGGDVEIISGGNIAIANGVDSSSGILKEDREPGNGGSIALRAPNGNIVTGGISTVVEDGNGGPIILESGGSITVNGKLISFAETQGNGGSIEVTAEDEIKVSERISTGTASFSGSGGNNGGDVEIVSNNGTVTLDDIVTGVFGDGSGGNITISSKGDILTGELVSGTLSGTPGDITITSTEGGLTIESGLLKEQIIGLCGDSFDCEHSGDTVTIATEFTLQGKTILFGATLAGTVQLNLSKDSATEPAVEPETPVATEPAVEPETPVATEPAVEPETPVATEPAVEPETPVATEPVVEPETPVATEPAVEPETPVATEPADLVNNSQLDRNVPNNSTEIILKLLDDGNDNTLSGTGVFVISEDNDLANSEDSNSEEIIDFFAQVNEIQGTFTSEFQSPSLFPGVFRGDAGSVDIQTRDGITIKTSFSFSAIEGDGGDFTAITDNTARTGSIDTSARDGDGGAIHIEGTQGVETVNLNSSSSLSGNGGEINVLSPRGAVTINNIDSSANQGNGGNVTVDALLDVSTRDINTSSNFGDGGNVQLSSETGNVTTGNVNTSAPLGTAGTFSVHQGAVIGNVSSAPANPPSIQTPIQLTAPPTVNPSQQLPSLQWSVTTNNSPAVSVDNVPILSELDRLAIDLIAPNLEIGGLQNTWDLRLEELDKLMTEDFSQYAKKDDSEIMTIENIKEMLGTIEAQTGQTPAVVYAISHPDFEREGHALEGGIALVLVTADGDPVVESIPFSQVYANASGNDVFSLVKRLYNRLENLDKDPKKIAEGKYLYKALVAPLEEAMEARGIDNIMFSLDSGLRSIPLALLHDGEQFLIEKYSVALIPSVTLTKADYRGLDNARLLAMGASTFPKSEHNQKALPNVPLELEMITTQGWNGDRFLNEEFTLEKMKAQRLSHPYGIIHLATHANFGTSEDEKTYIEFWDETIPLDTLREFSWHKEPQVELLVLSACKTAIGDLEAEMGFAGLAVRAGVKSSVATLWKVPDLQTMALMSVFYQYLQTEPIKAEALRKAQLAMLRGQVAIENGELVTPHHRVTLPAEIATRLKNVNESSAFSSPHAWAGFTLVGSPW
ncbi:CHAT domain-containing protein [Roseofilum casamattae]|uniref:CHAT domain-containing protein n=1 Tax=Roseofilum casamattae BLCC-M143 TaxID=3022442 RepID=A0ABT7C0L9_9CYAN|nr:CHAT domain-containing protein [Roseofilum casamattae]MDJ1184998.1 CHAT domain-containing protein [Roseofilum casamattae BLCC-M143]